MLAAVNPKIELLELMQLPSLKAEKARLLYLAGVQTIEDLSKTKVDDIVKILNKKSF